MVEEGTESHFGGEACRCPFGWRSGDQNSEKCSPNVMLHTKFCTELRKLSSRSIYSNVVRRGLGSAAQILRDVSVSSIQAQSLYVIVTCAVLCIFFSFFWNHRDACYCFCELFLAPHGFYIFVKDQHCVSNVSYCILLMLCQLINLKKAKKHVLCNLCSSVLMCSHPFPYMKYHFVLLNILTRNFALRHWTAIWEVTFPTPS